MCASPLWSWNSIPITPGSVARPSAKAEKASRTARRASTGPIRLRISTSVNVRMSMALPRSITRSISRTSGDAGNSRVTPHPTPGSVEHSLHDRKRVVDVYSMIEDVSREAGRTETGRNDHTGLVEASRDLFPVPPWEAHCHDPCPRMNIARGEHRCSQLLQPVHEMRCQREIVGESAVDAEVEDVLDGSAQRDTGAIAHGRELQTSRRMGKGHAGGIKSIWLDRAPPADERRVEPLEEGWTQVADGRAERRSQPLVATRDQHVDTARLHVDRDHPRRLRRVDYQRRVVGTGETCQLIERKSMSGGELHLTDADHCRSIIDQRRDGIE